jgi:hypothetical protein
MKLFHPTYFSPIEQYAIIMGEKNIFFEFEDHYQKQTYRTRCYISGANGKQLLNIPIKHGSSSRKTKDIQIDHDNSSWITNHLKSLQAAYRSSPFYEYYEDEIVNIFTQKNKYLIDLNIAIHTFIIASLQEGSTYLKTKEFTNDSLVLDYRYLVNSKRKTYIKFPKYVQMFDDKHGFQENLSILDLLFMEGPASYKYLRSVAKIIL